jgi:hypothetical protein
MEGSFISILFLSFFVVWEMLPDRDGEKENLAMEVEEDWKLINRADGSRTWRQQMFSFFSQGSLFIRLVWGCFLLFTEIGTNEYFLADESWYHMSA